MVPGDLGDSRLVNYFLEHCHKFFTGNVSSFWDAPFMFPEKSTITFSENMLGSAPFYSFFRIMGLDRPDAYQAWILLMHILNFSAAYLLFYKIIRNPFSAGLGAFVFAFSLALMSQVVTTQMYPRFPIPLTLLMLYFFMDQFNPRYFFLATLFLVYQFYCVIYLGFILFIPFAAILITTFIVRKDVFFIKIKSIVWWKKISIGLIVNIILIIVLLYPYLLRASLNGSNSYDSIFSTIPTLKSYFFSSIGSFSWQSLGKIMLDEPSFWIHSLFAGAIAVVSYLLFLLFGLANLTKKTIFSKIQFDMKMKIFLISAFVFLLIFTRFGSFSFYKMVFYLPGFGALRNMCRMINIQLVFYGLALAFIFSILPFKKTITKFLAFFILLILLIPDNYTKDLSMYRSSKIRREQGVEVLQKKLIHIPFGSIISYEPDTLIEYPFVYHLDAMLACQQLNLICINGYSGNVPVGYYNYANLLNKSSRILYFSTIGYTPKSLIVIK